MATMVDLRGTRMSAALNDADGSKALPLMRESQAANYLACTSRQLKDARLRGGGPRYVRIGNTPLYRQDWLDTFAATNSVTSTSEETSRRRP